MQSRGEIANTTQLLKDLGIILVKANKFISSYKLKTSIRNTELQVEVNT